MGDTRTHVGMHVHHSHARARRRGGRVLLGHEMGLGKTPMAITIVSHCIASGQAPVLIVAPPVRERGTTGYGRYGGLRQLRQCHAAQSSWLRQGCAR